VEYAEGSTDIVPLNHASVINSLASAHAATNVKSETKHEESMEVDDTATRKEADNHAPVKTEHAASDPMTQLRAFLDAIEDDA
jgi:hypothetical protein